jgi:DNA-binding FadR family transcriptional regulator
MATRHTDLLTRLGLRIVDGSLPEGTVITLDGVGRQYGVSRTVAREVVQVLTSMGMVESRRRTGVRVLPPSAWDVFDPAVIRWQLAGPDRTAVLHQLSQLRAAIEPPAAALAATNADDKLRRTIVDTAEVLERTGAAGDLQTFLEHDVRFHRLLLEGSGNTMFRGLSDVVAEVLRGRTDHHLMPPHPKPEARRLHAVVAEAVAGGEPEVARAAMTAICAEVVAEMGRL